LNGELGLSGALRVRGSILSDGGWRALHMPLDEAPLVIGRFEREQRGLAARNA
jgi:hypothetical protein